MSYSGEPVNKADTIPIYIVVIRDLKDPAKYQYIKTRQDLYNAYETHLDVRGVLITKTIADKLTKTDRELTGTVEQLYIPLHQWIITKNISYNGLAKK